MCACNKDICPPLKIKFAESEAVFLAEIISAKPVEGFYVIKQLKEGDIFIVSSLDRAFRSSFMEM